MSSSRRLRLAALAAITTATGVGVAATPANALTLFTLDDVTFDDGGIATGTFLLNSTTGAISGVDITTTDGESELGTQYGQNINDYSEADVADGLYVFAFFDNNNRILNLYVPTPIELDGSNALITENDPVNFNESSEFSDAEEGSRGILTGQLDAPEPASLALLTTGLAGLGYARRRKTI